MNQMYIIARRKAAKGSCMTDLPVVFLAFAKRRNTDVPDVSFCVDIPRQRQRACAGMSRDL